MLLFITSYSKLLSTNRNNLSSTISFKHTIYPDLSHQKSILVSLKASKETTRVCRVCKQTYLPSRNHPRACRYHLSTWTGAECSKFYGRIPETCDGTLRGIEYYFDCCDATVSDAPGCTTSFHISYDDE